MEKLMFKTNSDDRITQDQRLALQSKLIEYMREALAQEKGWVVFEVEDLETFEFDFYYSSSGEIKSRIEEPKQQTLDRILFTINCVELNALGDVDEDLDSMLKHLYNYIIGFISVNKLYEKYGISDHSSVFKEADWTKNSLWDQSHE